MGANSFSFRVDQFAPYGNKFWPVRVDAFSEEDENDCAVVSPEIVSIPLNLLYTRCSERKRHLQNISNSEGQELQ